MATGAGITTATTMDITDSMGTLVITVIMAITKGLPTVP